LPGFGAGIRLRCVALLCQIFSWRQYFLINRSINESITIFTILSAKFFDMFIEHIAIWCNNLEEMKAFYCKWFNATANNIYHNHAKKYASYFLSFEQGARLELMQMEGIPENANNIIKQYKGLIHFALCVKTKEAVDELTENLRNAGHTVVGEPRTTGDGYYESVVLDPEENRIEITA